MYKYLFKIFAIFFLVGCIYLLISPILVKATTEKIVAENQELNNSNIIDANNQNQLIRSYE